MSLCLPCCSQGRINKRGPRPHKATVPRSHEGTFKLPSRPRAQASWPLAASHTLQEGLYSISSSHLHSCALRCPQYASPLQMEKLRLPGLKEGGHGGNKRQNLDPKPALSGLLSSPHLDNTSFRKPPGNLALSVNSLFLEPPS